MTGQPKVQQQPKGQRQGRPKNSAVSPPAARRVSGAGRPKLTVATPDAELRIREAALDLFAARGFSAVTTKDIADATGFNPALIYYYFGSKEELFRRAVTLAVDRAFEQFRISRQNLHRPRDVIHGWLETHILQFDTIAKLIMISVDYARASKRKARIDEAVHKFYDDEREVLRQTLAAGIQSGDFRKVDVPETATFISTYLDGVFFRAMVLKKFDPVAAIRELRTFLDMHLAPHAPGPKAR
jgi:AcrR family transcriptional regulator